MTCVQAPRRLPPRRRRPAVAGWHNAIGFSAGAEGARGRRIRALVRGLCVVAVSLAASGAGAASLEEALALAYHNNPELLAERAALRATDEQVSEARAGWRPTVTATGEVGVTSVDSTGTRTPESYTLGLRQPVFRGGRTVAATRAAESLVLAGRARLAEVEQDVLLSAVTVYLDVWRAGAVVGLAVNNERRLERTLEATRDRFEVGDVSRTDVAQAEARLSLAIAERIRAQGDLTAARAAYLNVVGAAPGSLAQPPPLGRLPEGEATALDAAAADNPTLIRSIHQERAARADVREALGVLLPEVSLDAELRHAVDQSPTSGTTDSAEFTARVTIPLYQSGAEYARLRAAREVVSQRRLEIESERRAVTENVTLSWQTLQTARAEITAFRDAVRANGIALEGAEQEATVGTRTTLDVLDAEQELFDARIDLVRAQRDEVVASYALAAAVGRLSARALGLPVELYDEGRHYQAVRDKLWGLGPRR